MAFDQPNQPPHRPQAQTEQSNSTGLPPITSEEWEYNRYNPGPMNNRNYYPNSYPNQPPQQTYPPHPPQEQPLDYASRASYPASSWEQV